MQNLIQFETVIRELTRPVNNQYPRPFTCDFKNPLSAKGLILGYNQARTYSTDLLSHQEFLDYHFGRSGTSRELYGRLSPEPSKTRVNIENMVRYLDQPILESDVYCFSSRKASELSSEGKVIGARISQAVIAGLCPKFILVFSANSQKAFPKELRAVKAIVSEQTLPPQGKLSISKLVLNRKALNTNYEGNFETTVIYMPSLSLPEWNKWKSESLVVFAQIATILKEFI
ncbi:MAG: hypothetical protein H3C47_11250 [Candidatus Cloacimonetes bacterium]|nr:hypothetical protein [Candidatus Cloacimonadota bacterium]